MDYEELGDLHGIPIRVPASEDYRTCAVCGGDCEPDPAFGSDEHGARIAFACPEHGIRALIDPFEDLRERP